MKTSEEESITDSEREVLINAILHLVEESKIDTTESYEIFVEAQRRYQKTGKKGW